MKVTTEHNDIKKVIENNHKRSCGSSAWRNCHEFDGKRFMFRSWEVVATVEDKHGKWDVTIERTSEIMKSAHGNADWTMQFRRS